MELTIDCRQEMAAIHEQFAQGLSFPAHYGKNLDALHDCLTSLTGIVHLRLLYPEAQPALCMVVMDAADENPSIDLRLA